MHIHEAKRKTKQKQSQNQKLTTKENYLIIQVSNKLIIFQRISIEVLFMLLYYKSMTPIHST